MPEAFHAAFPVNRSGGRSSVTVPRGFAGGAVWGPYQDLGAGKYEVAIEIAPLEFESRDEECCIVDVVTSAGRETLLKRPLSVHDLLEADNKVRLTFELAHRGSAEYRVFGAGGAGFRVNYYRKAHAIGARGQRVSLEDVPVYGENFASIDRFQESGIEFAVEGDALIASAGGIRVEVRNSEDLQVLDEVFLVREYNVLPPRACIAFDIGMNVGFASLALAANPQIDMVFSYEPFAAPFGRAAENFRRNPALEKKVRAMNFGLADRNEDFEVRSDPGATIGTSIRGVGSGRLERIAIRDAAGELGPKIEEARRRSLGIVIKVDCEGSEFAIFESLERASLFDRIDALMIEWHKWWSATKTQADLIAPLKAAGFVVFDRTHPGNPHAGFLLAVKLGASRGEDGRPSHTA